MKRIMMVALASTLAACGSKPADPAPTPKVLVSLAAPQRGSRPEWITGYGSAAPSVNSVVTISMPQPGQVTSLSVVPGTPVRAGQTLAVFVVAPTSVSAFKQAQTALAAAQKQRATTGQLVTQQLATRDQLTQSEKAVSDAQAILVGLQREGGGQPVRPLLAPFDGVVTGVSVAQGDRTQPGAPILTVTRAGGIIALVGIDASSRNLVRVGQQARITRLNGGPTMLGRVIQASGALNLKTRLIDVGVSIPAGVLLPNEAISADIATRQVGGWLVPHRAVVTANGPTHVFQVVGGKAKALRVNLLLAGDQIDVIDGPLDPNQRIVVNGAYQVSSGDAVRTAAGQ